MAGTVTEASSSLASELLLNKIMNGQVQTSTGKSITAAGRALSSKLSSNAYELRVAEKNMVYGEGLVSAAQSELSGIRDQLTNLKASLLDLRDGGAAGQTAGAIEKLGKEAAEVKAQVSAALGSKYNGVVLNTAAAINLNSGNGMSISVLGDQMTLTTLLDKLTGVKNMTGVKDAITAIDSAVEDILGQEAKYSATIKALQNRQILLADQGAGLDNTAASQSVTGMNGASNLLNAMLGNTEV